jgi:hypothetical protein
MREVDLSFLVAAASMTISKVQDAVVHGPHSRVAVIVQCDFLSFPIACFALSTGYLGSIINDLLLILGLPLASV